MKSKNSDHKTKMSKKDQKRFVILSEALSMPGYTFPEETWNEFLELFKKDAQTK